MPAPSLYIGTVTVFGIDGTMTFTGVGSVGIETTENLLESISYEDATEEHESKDKYGEVIGLKLFNARENLTINFYPAKPAGSSAIAGAKTNAVLPVKGSKVVIADMPGYTADAGPNGTKWLYIQGGTIEYTNAGDVKMVLPLRRYSTDIAATANT